MPSCQPTTDGRRKDLVRIHRKPCEAKPTRRKTSHDRPEDYISDPGGGKKNPSVRWAWSCCRDLLVRTYQRAKYSAFIHNNMRSPATMSIRLTGNIFFFLPIALLMLQSMELSGASLVETKEQCEAIVEASPSSSSRSLTQNFYPPNRSTLSDFIATCMGSTELPVITKNGEARPTIDRFKMEDCGSTILQCCNVDPSPGEVLCDYSRLVRCDLFASPEDPWQITCNTGILAMLTPRDETVVMANEGSDYMYFPSADTPAEVQPDGSIRFSPKTDRSTRAIVARPTDLSAYGDTCKDNIYVEFPNALNACMGFVPPQPAPQASPDPKPTEPDSQPSPDPQPTEPEPSSSGCVLADDQVYDTYAGNCLAMMLQQPPPCSVAPFCYDMFGAGICNLIACEDRMDQYSCNNIPYCSWILEDEEVAPNGNSEMPDEETSIAPPNPELPPDTSTVALDEDSSASIVLPIHCIQMVLILSALIFF